MVSSSGASPSVDEGSGGGSGDWATVAAVAAAMVGNISRDGNAVTWHIYCLHDRNALCLFE